MKVSIVNPHDPWWNQEILGGEPEFCSGFNPDHEQISCGGLGEILLQHGKFSDKICPSCAQHIIIRLQWAIGTIDAKTASEWLTT